MSYRPINKRLEQFSPLNLFKRFFLNAFLLTAFLVTPNQFALALDVSPSPLVSTAQMDSDEDGLSDLSELKQFNSNPNNPDTNGDEVNDGVAVAVGAHPVTGAPMTSATPKINWISTQNMTTCPARGTIGVRLNQVPGATGYKVTATTNGNVVYSQELHFELNQMVVSDQIAVVKLDQFPFPLTTTQLEIQGFYGSPDNLQGGAETHSINCASRAQESDYLVQQNETWIQTRVHANITIESGCFITVPANQHLTILANSLDIQQGAGIIAEHGASISILTSQSVLVSGNIHAGDGAHADPLIFNAATGPAVVQGHIGSMAGDVQIFSEQIHFIGQPSVRAGDGGRGGDATAKGGDARIIENSGEAIARGGRGGRGGNLLLFSRLSFTGVTDYSLHSGNGGDGGDAFAYGGDGLNLKRSSAAVAAAGGGGNSGDLFVSDPTSIPGTHRSLGFGITGGSGGKPGTANADSGSGGGEQCPQPPELVVTGQGSHPLPLRDCECPVESEDGEEGGRDALGNIVKGEKGANGWRNPGDGGYVISVAGDGTGCGEGGDAYAEGGDGGNIKSFGFSKYGIGIQMSLSVGPLDRRYGGDGGKAVALGGDGGECGVGKGGLGYAIGGKGGDGTTAFAGSGVFGGGGKGGRGEGYGGTGHKGYSCCNYPPGQAGNGGEGGKGEGFGGNGGDGALTGGNGGVGHGTAGDGGDGGDGCGPGSPGNGGRATARGGDGGSGTILFDGNTGRHWRRHGDDGQLGIDCCTTSQIEIPLLGIGQSVRICLGSLNLPAAM